ncbi:MAG TPA: GntR family transcriptional regulator [Bryobacteraceae bacterium]|nr:GntR family transcriptional regulator [Bryobacteraceae bacterium]
MTKAAQPDTPFGVQLDLRSGVPVYRQIMDQVLAGIASGRLVSGDQLPTVRQLAVDLSINPNTVIRAYRELEIRGFLDTHQGSGTFIGTQRVEQDGVERQRKLDGIVSDLVARAGAEGFTALQVLERLQGLLAEQKPRRN